MLISITISVALFVATAYLHLMSLRLCSGPMNFEQGLTDFDGVSHARVQQNARCFASRRACELGNLGDATVVDCRNLSCVSGLDRLDLWRFARFGEPTLRCTNRHEIRL